MLRWGPNIFENTAKQRSEGMSADFTVERTFEGRDSCLQWSVESQADVQSTKESVLNVVQSTATRY